MNKLVELESAEKNENKIILDRYQVIQELASTRFSTVFKALDNKMQRLVAIKMIESSSKATTWAKREAQLSAQLNHPNICTIYEYEETPKAHYLIMEYLEGLTLREILDEFETLDLDETISIAKEICLALECAHLNYIVHKDIKPENILLLKDGRLKIMDFGTGRLMGQVKEAHSSLFGTPAYMAPEQLKRAHLDDRVDQFSLATVIYECLSGASPFDATTTAASIYKVEHSKPANLVEANGDVDQSLNDAIAKALSKNPDSRYETVTDFRYKLERAYPPPLSTKKVLANLVERCNSQEIEHIGKQGFFLNSVRNIVGEIYSRAHVLINKALAVSLVSILGFFLFRVVGNSYSLPAAGLLAGLSLFSLSWGLLALGAIGLIGLALEGFFLPAVFLFSGGLVWHFLLGKKWSFELAFSTAAPILTFFNLQILFPIFSGLAFSPTRALLINFAAAAQVLVFSAFFKSDTALVNNYLLLSQLLTWPLISFLMSLVLARKTLAKVIATTIIAFVLLISTYIVIGTGQKESFDFILKSASLSLIITLLILPLMPFNRVHD